MPPFPSNPNGSVNKYELSPGVTSYWDSTGRNVMTYDTPLPGMSTYYGTDRYGTPKDSGTIFEPVGSARPLTAPPNTGNVLDMYEWMNGRR